MWHNGEYTDLGSMIGPFSEAWDINENGAVTGWTGAGQAQNGSRAFLHVRGETMILPVHPLGNAANGWAINNNNDVVGWATVNASFSSGRAALWTNRSIVELQMPDGYTSSAAKGVNDNMEIVGSCGVPIDKSMPSRLPCLWRHGDVFDVNTLLIQHSGVLRLTTAEAINDNGQILAEGRHFELGDVAVILSPVEAIDGDVDRNCKVNVDDLLDVINGWGAGPSPADINDDGLVNVLDLMIVIQSWTYY
jgi:uncharacterized membrane protein